MMTKIKTRKISIAPMMQWTDRHCRAFFRQFSPNLLLYTEMIPAGTIIHGDRKKYLGFNAIEHPVALQIGGKDPKELAACSKIGEEFGYDEINLNVGCPSSRVQTGQFGACLMKTPEIVAEGIAAMQKAVTVPVTVKCRIGVDDQDSWEDFFNFINVVAKTGSQTFIIHARKAWLGGISPKENRTKPPLQYDFVYRLKKELPHLTIILNGGIKSWEHIEEHLKWIDGVMIGREAYNNPYFLAPVEKKLFDPNAKIPSHFEIIQRYRTYMENQLRAGVPLKRFAGHLMGFFHGVRGARYWRKHLNQNAQRPKAGFETIEEALGLIQKNTAEPLLMTN